MTYAQIIGGFVQNCVDRPVGECFSPDYIASETDAGRPWVAVPDGTLSGAKDMGDGTFQNPVLPTPTGGRDINRAEFLDIAMATNPAVFNAILAGMPVVGLYLDDYKGVTGIRYADTATDSRITRLFAAAKQANLLTDEIIADFRDKWVELYPAV